MLKIGRMAMLAVPLGVGLLLGYVWGAAAKEHSQAMAAEGAKNPPACCKTADAGDKPQGGCCCAKKEKTQAQDTSAAEAKTPPTCCKPMIVTEMPQGGCCCAKKATPPAEDAPTDQGPTEGKE